MDKGPADPPLAVTVDIGWLGGVCEPGPLAAQPGVRVQRLRHLVADHVHQPLEHSLGACAYMQLIVADRIHKVARICQKNV